MLIYLIAPHFALSISNDVQIYELLIFNSRIDGLIGLNGVSNYIFNSQHSILLMIKYTTWNNVFVYSAVVYSNKPISWYPHSVWQSLTPHHSLSSSEVVEMISQYLELWYWKQRNSRYWKIMEKWTSPFFPLASRLPLHYSKIQYALAINTHTRNNGQTKKLNAWIISTIHKKSYVKNQIYTHFTSHCVGHWSVLQTQPTGNSTTTHGCEPLKCERQSWNKCLSKWHKS